MRVLGIETTCDETAVAIVRLKPDGSGEILADEIMSQIAAQGGASPEKTARAHVEVLDQLIARALAKAGVKASQLDAVAAAAGPGLSACLEVGLAAAKGVAIAANKPFLAINQLEAHALIPRLDGRLNFPYLLLVASGDQTQIVAVEGVGAYIRLGATRDDSIGDAFDKTARILGLAYPSAPAVEAAAAPGNPERFALPRPMLGQPHADFSLASFKIAVREAATAAGPLSPQAVADLCASFQAAVADVAEDRLRAALGLYHQRGGMARALGIVGDIAGNATLRATLARFAQTTGLPFLAPPLRLCKNNGAVIAWAGIERSRLGAVDDLSAPARPRWPLGVKAEPAPRP